MTLSAIFSPERPLRIGTRRSPLALAQAQMAAAALAEYHRLPAEAITLVPMLALGDRITDRPLADIGGKALWTKELDRALLDGEIDIAVHSMKDVETLRPAHYHVAAMLARADVRDRLIGAPSIADLPPGAHVGTSSPRRAAILRALRPDLRISPIRGNVATRIAQVTSGAFDATLLAAAGLDRLSQTDMGAAIAISQMLPAAAGLDRLSQTDMGAAIAISQMLPAAAQGAIGIECLRNRADLGAFVAAINHQETYACVSAERAFLAALGGSCHSPVAALARRDGDQIWLRAEILREDGSERQAGEVRFKPADMAAPARLAAKLLGKASAALRALFDA